MFIMTIITIAVISIVMNTIMIVTIIIIVIIRSPPVREGHREGRAGQLDQVHWCVVNENIKRKPTKQYNNYK